jgi:hypothetical protein
VNIVRISAAYQIGNEPQTRAFKYREPDAAQMIEIEFTDYSGTAIMTIPVFAVPHLVDGGKGEIHMTEFSDIPEQPYDWQHVPRYRGGNRVTLNRLNPKPLKTPRSPARLAPAVKKVTGLKVPRGATASDPDNGYWNLVASACFVLFFLYIVAHNELQAWANILLWQPAKAIQVGDSPLTPGSAASAAAAGPPAIGAPLVNPVSSTLGQLQTQGFFPQQFQGITPQSGVIGWLNGAAIPAGQPTTTTAPGTSTGTGGIYNTLKRFGIVR